MSFDEKLRQLHEAERESLAREQSQDAAARAWEQEVRDLVNEAIARLAAAGYPGLERRTVEKHGFFRLGAESVEGWRYGSGFLTVNGEFRRGGLFAPSRVTAPVALWEIFRCSQETGWADAVYYAPEHVSVLPVSEIQDRLVRLLADLGME